MLKTTKNNILYIIITVFLLNGCASMLSGTKENIVMRSEEKDTKFYVNEEYIGEGSAITTISKKKLKDTTIRASKKGCRDTVRTIETKFDPTSLFGCLFDFCIVSVLVVDWGLTGAVNEAAQTNYFITPACN